MSRGSYLAYMNDFGMRLSGHTVHLAALWNASCCLALDKLVAVLNIEVLTFTVDEANRINSHCDRLPDSRDIER